MGVSLKCIYLRNIYRYLVYSTDVKRTTLCILLSIDCPVLCLKVEDACYAIAVRGSEIPDNFVVDMFDKNNDEYGDEN